METVKIIVKIKRTLGRLLNSFLSRWNYQITRLNFLNASDLKRRSRLKNMTIPDFVEYEDSLTNKCKLGKSKRVIDRIFSHLIGASSFPLSILEIGPGTARYTDKVLKKYPNCKYEIYETALDWADYIKKTYAKSADFTIQKANGKNLSATPDEVCDVSHAHAVFVYLPHCITLSYLDEMVRVTKKGGLIAFDLFFDRAFDVDILRRHLQSQMTFPIIFPSEIFKQWVKQHNLEFVDFFDEPYGIHYSSYYVLRK